MPRRSIAGAMSALVSASLVCGPAAAQSAAEFYKGRQLTFLISHPPGGGFDTYARFFGRHLGRLMVGNPNVVMQNMPGAAGVAMANHMFTQAARDGSVIALGPGQLTTAALLGATGIRFDAQQFNWIGNINSEVALAYSWHTHPVKTAKDLKTHELVVAASGATDFSAMAPLALGRLLDLKLKVVTGYPGSAGQVLAVERGEVGGIGGYYYSSLKTVRPQWIKDKQINILVQYAFEAHTELPGVPTLPELAPSAELRDTLALIFQPQQMGRPIFAPPGVPADRLKALRDAFEAFIKDPEVNQDSVKTRTEMYRPMRGEEIAKMVERFHSFPPNIARRAAQASLPSDVAGAPKKK